MDAPIRLDAGEDTTQCVAGSLVLKASTSGAPVDLLWSNRPGFGVALGVAPTLTITPMRGSETFYLRATSKLGCVETDSVTVRSLPLLATLQPKAVACISGTLINLSVSNRDTLQQLRYLWSPANLIISDPANGPDAIVKAQDNTVIQVALSNQFGCTDTLRTNVVVPDLPSRLSIQADKNPIRKGEQSVITVNGCTQCAFSWSPATGLNTTSGPSVIASPEETTIYTVKATREGCEHTLSIRIEVKQCVEPFLPNAFTPNGDGINDVLYARLKDYEAMQLIIYNRWGQEVFDTRNPDVGWDGTFRGRQLPPDVYGFYLYMICPDGTEYKKRGNISLIR
jgi:gliding motility-associated-like protein